MSLWQAKDRKLEPGEQPETSYPLPEFGDYMVYLKKSKDRNFERFSETWEFHKLSDAPNVRLRQPPVYLWRDVREVAPFISAVGDKIRYRSYRTRLIEDQFELTSQVLAPGDLIVLDVARRKVLRAKESGKRLEVRHTVPKGVTMMQDLNLSQYFDLNLPGEYWLFTDDPAPLRFEVSDKLQVYRPGD